MCEIQQKTAFITAYEKAGVPQFAHDLHTAGYQIVSLGGTAELIEGAQLPVTRTEEFLGAVGPQNIESLPDRSRREVVAASLAQTLSLAREELQELDWPVIDLAYINLMPHKNGTRLDKGGILMIDAAVEGSVLGRSILVEPWQLKEYHDVQHLDADHANDPNLAAIHRQVLACTALSYVEAYHTGAYDVAHADLMP